MLRRKVFDTLAEWKGQKERKSLLVRGARQVGKSFAVTEFGLRNYREMISINFKEKPSLSELFLGDLDVDSMLMAMKFRFPDKLFVPGETLIFLDEIQECPEAITSLKFWTIDGRFDVIASGSMLGIDYRRASSYPVGYVDYIDMCGLDFEEFLWSQGVSDDMILGLKRSFDEHIPVQKAVNSVMLGHFRTYMALGGMPEVVQTFVDTKDFRAVDRVQRALLQGYQYDIAHYANASEKIKAERCFMSLTAQLLDKENHKFQYKDVERGGKAQKYGSSLDWLFRSDIVRMVSNVSDLRFDLDDYSIDGNFRVYASDLSLLIPMKDFSLKQEIIDDTLSGTTRGGIYESAIADVLCKRGLKVKFYRNESKKWEIDFLVQKEGKVIPIEVKSRNSTAKSLNSVMDRYLDIPIAYKLVEGNVGEVNGRILTLPLYMAMFI